MDSQQIEVLYALETGLEAALAQAQSSHDETLAHMDAAWRTLDALLRNEATETALYVDDTRLHMRALRDVVQLEMDKARREVDAFLQDATRNATHARDARDRTRRETREKTLMLQAQRQYRQNEWREQIERVKREAAEEAARLHDEMSCFHEPVGGSRMTEITEAVQTQPVWVLSFVGSLVLGACLWVWFATFRARRAATARRQRVLYSEQLKSHFANSGHLEVDTTSTRDKQQHDTHSPRSPSGFEKRPTLHRRLRPAWSPAASTASTVSSPETPKSIFASHNAFASATPAPF